MKGSVVTPTLFRKKFSLFLKHCLTNSISTHALENHQYSAPNLGQIQQTRVKVTACQFVYTKRPAPSGAGRFTKFLTDRNFLGFFNFFLYSIVTSRSNTLLHFKIKFILFHVYPHRTTTKHAFIYHQTGYWR